MDSTKLNSRQKQAIKTKRKIINTAFKLFQKKGYQNTTIKDICTQANISVGDFYHHFPSKLGIFNELHGSMDQLFFDTLAPLDESNYLFSICSFFNNYSYCNHSIGKDTIKILINPQNEELSSTNESMFLYLKNMIDEAQSKGVLKTEFTSEFIANHLFLVARGLILAWCHDNIDDLTKEMQQLIELELRLFLPDK